MAVKRSSKGSALISALFLMTLVAIGATAMSARLQLDIYRTRLILTSDALSLASEAVTFWAMDMIQRQTPIQLSEKFNQNKGTINYPKSFENLYPDVSIRGSLMDLQALFNLNNLQEAEQTAVFYRLLKTVLPEDKKSDVGKILNATKDWITESGNQKNNEFSSVYRQRKPAYQAAHQPMQSISEFRLVQGIEPDLYQTLLPYITALPSNKTPININTAPKAILMILGQGLDDTEAESLMQARGERGFQTLEEATELLTSLHIPLDQITLESNYFLSTAITQTKEHQTLSHYTILRRIKDPDGQIRVQMIFNSFHAL